LKMDPKKNSNAVGGGGNVTVNQNTN